MQSQEQLKSLSKLLAQTIVEQRRAIAESKEYLRRQQDLINETINVGNNHIFQLTLESDALAQVISDARGQLIELDRKVDDKRFELLMMGDSLST